MVVNVLVGVSMNCLLFSATMVIVYVYLAFKLNG